MNSFAPSGLHLKTSAFIASTIAKFGFNCVRLNWSLELAVTNPVVNKNAIHALIRARAFGNRTVIRALDVLDVIVDDLARSKIMVVLDNHISDAGWYFLVIFPMR